MDEKTWRLAIDARPENVDMLQGLLALRVSFGWEEKELPNGEAQFLVHSDSMDFLQGLAAEIATRLPDAKTSLSETAKKDWLSAWRQFFTPVECGERFVVLPPWLAHMEHSTRKAVIIDPKSAFGTGHHASTRLCLEALSDLADEGRIRKGGWFLDLGCGSGVLGIAACKLGMDGTGVDIDPIAIANAKENRELNEAARLELLKGSLEKVKGEKFDLVFANILARPLIEMASRLMASLKKDGCLILSGILDSQAEDVAAAYAALGKPKIKAEDEWRALIWAYREKAFSLNTSR